MNKRILWRTIRPLMLLPVLAASLQARSIRLPSTVREAVAGGIRLRAELTTGFGAAAHMARLHVRVTNELPVPVRIPSGPKENGLAFHLADDQGRMILDAERKAFTEELRFLGPGQALDSTIDLSSRELFVASNRPWGEGFPIRGVFDARLGEVAFLDLHVSQTVAEGRVLELAPIRLVLSQTLAARSAHFASLHGAVEEAVEEAIESTRGGGAMRPLPYPMPPEGDDPRMRPWASAAIQVFDPTRPIHPGPEFAPGVVLVTFAEGTELAAARETVEALGFTVEAENLFRFARILTVGVPAGEEEACLDVLRKSAGVKQAHLNHIARIM